MRKGERPGGRWLALRRRCSSRWAWEPPSTSPQLYVWRFYLALRWTSPMSWGPGPWSPTGDPPLGLASLSEEQFEGRMGSAGWRPSAGFCARRAPSRSARRGGSPGGTWGPALHEECTPGPALHARRPRPLELGAARSALPGLRPLHRRGLPHALPGDRGRAPLPGARDVLAIGIEFALILLFLVGPPPRAPPAGRPPACSSGVASPPSSGRWWSSGGCSCRRSSRPWSRSCTTASPPWPPAGSRGRLRAALDFVAAGQV